MTFKVTIEHHPSGAFERTLEIERTSMPVFLENGHRDPEAVGTYLVRSLFSDGRLRQAARFEHRYGDDLLTLVAEAIDALGGRLGAEAKR